MNFIVKQENVSAHNSYAIVNKIQTKNSTNFFRCFAFASDVQHCLDGSDESPRYSCISSKFCLTPLLVSS